jgi:hypothetical protein
MISPHDYKVAHSAAVALCGGDVDTGVKVDEDWLLAVERREFMALLRTPETPGTHSPHPGNRQAVAQLNKEHS